MKYLLIALLLTGCATEDYSQYAKSAEASSVARSQALAKIAESPDTTAKVAAVMALSMGNNQIAPPPQNQLLQWLSIIVPSLTQAYGIRMNAIMSMAASENTTKTAITTNEAFVSIAGKIQAPVVNPTIIPPVVIIPVINTPGVTVGP